MSKKGNGHTPPKQYKSYRFTKFDPEMDRLRDMVLDKGLTKAELSRNSGVSTGTFDSWWGTKGRKRKTMRPQNASIEATGRAFGFERRWHRIKDKEA